MGTVIIVASASAAIAASSVAARTARLKEETVLAEKDGCLTILQNPPEVEGSSLFYTTCSSTYPTVAYEYEDHTVADMALLGVIVLFAVVFCGALIYANRR